MASPWVAKSTSRRTEQKTVSAGQDFHIVVDDQQSAHVQGYGQKSVSKTIPVPGSYFNQQHFYLHGINRTHGRNPLTAPCANSTPRGLPCRVRTAPAPPATDGAHTVILSQRTSAPGQDEPILFQQSCLGLTDDRTGRAAPLFRALQPNHQQLGGIHPPRADCRVYPVDYGQRRSAYRMLGRPAESPSNQEPLDEAASRCRYWPL